MKVMKLSSLMCVLFLYAVAAVAWLRPEYEDATVVDRSELIVVAHIKPGSIEYVPHKTKPDEGARWEHHATLVISEVLKGECDDKEIPIVIHYGLDPVVGGHATVDQIRRDQFVKANPNDVIGIIDTGGKHRGGSPIVEDAREDNLWFLRRRSGLYGREPGKGNYGIVDPEDLSPLEWKPYFLCYLSDNPADAVRKFAAEHPKAAVRVKSYLDHLEVQAILKIKDPKERYEKLLPFFLSGTTWNMKPEATYGIISCGMVGAEELRRLFDDPQYGRFRDEILAMWVRMGYKQAVPLVIELLKKHDQFWARQQLEKGWWNKDPESELTRRRQAVYGEVYSGVYLLRNFPDPRAKEVLELTRNRWKSLAFENPQIVDECEAALRALSQRQRKEIAVDLGGGVNLKMVLIPAGEFKMGSGESAEATAAFFNKTFVGQPMIPPDFFKDEHPQHGVRITKPFYLGTYHVTRGQFRQFVADTGYKTDAEKGKRPGAVGWDPDKKGFVGSAKYSWRNAGFEQTDGHPVVNVSWNDAAAFCKWLSKKEGKTYRLPTEAEWEYACRARTTTRYYSGDDPETLAKVGNVADAAAKAQFPNWTYTIKANDGYVFTAPVGKFKPNAFGLYDMHGNAWQWCADWWAEYYATSPVDDPTGPASGNLRVLRGGSWSCCGSWCGYRPAGSRSAGRLGSYPDGRDFEIGFRVARTQ